MSGEDVRPSDGLDRLTGTFSRDRVYFDALLRANGREIARILIHVRWAMHYVPEIQVEMEGLTPAHFDPVHEKEAGFWTLALLGATMKDLGLVGYFVVRGLLSDAGMVVRRALENIATLATLWNEPGTAAFLASPEDESFRKAFIWESNQAARATLKIRGVQKRFAHCAYPQALSHGYTLLSKYSVHGGSPHALARAELNPTAYSCMFLNRPDPIANDISMDVVVIGNTVEMIAIEIVTLLGDIRSRYRLPPSLAGEGGFFMSRLIDPETGEMDRLIASTLRELGMSDWNRSA